MALLDMFDTFNETIFVKSDSNLEKEIEKLEKLKNDSNKNSIERDINLLKLGLIGENQIIYELKNANIGMYVLHDVTFNYENQIAQVDFIIITKVYTYFVECKNLIGDIYVSNTGEFRREYFWNGKKYKEAIYSPYTQCLRHRDIYEKVWKARNTGFLYKTLWKNAVTDWIKPLVVLANSKGILNVRYAPKEVRNYTIRIDNLVNYIKKDIASIDKSYYLSKKQMEDSAKSWLKINIDGSTCISDKYVKMDTDVENNDVSLNSDADDLKRELEDFRRNRSKIMNIPAYYVFTNDEMNEILKNKPKNIDELRKILPAIKVKVHGNEIVKIVNDGN